jgi:hypothetical protein
LIEDIKFRRFHTANWIAYLLATAIAYVTSLVELGIPTVNGIVAAVILLFIVNKIFDALGISCGHTASESAAYIYGSKEE